MSRKLDLPPKLCPPHTPGLERLERTVTNDLPFEEPPDACQYGRSRIRL